MTLWDWPIAGMALLSMWMLGNKKRTGWIVKCASQATSVPLNIALGLWAFAILGVFGTLISAWNWWKWGKDA